MFSASDDECHSSRRTDSSGGSEVSVTTPTRRGELVAVPMDNPVYNQGMHGYVAEGKGVFSTTNSYFLFCDLFNVFCLCKAILAIVTLSSVDNSISTNSPSSHRPSSL